MSQKSAEFIFDNRIVQRNIRDARVDRKEYEKYLASLPDLENKCETLSLDVFSRSHSSFAQSQHLNSEDE